jgi:hypothetical protein
MEWNKIAVYDSPYRHGAACTKSTDCVPSGTCRKHNDCEQERTSPAKYIRDAAKNRLKSSRSKQKGGR